MWMALPSALSCTVSYYCTDLYDPRVVNDFKEFRARLPRALVLAAALLGLYFAFATSLGLSMVHLSYALMGALFAIAISVPARWTASSVLRKPPFSERILILGTGPLALRIATALSTPDRTSHELAALEEGEGGLGVSTSSRLPRCPVLGSLSDLEKVIGEFRPHRIVVALTERRRRLPVQELLRHLVMNEIAVEDGVQAYERTAGKLALENLNPSFLLFSGAFKKSSLLLALQRGLSIAVSVAGLIVTAPSDRDDRDRHQARLQGADILPPVPRGRPRQALRPHQVPHHAAGRSGDGAQPVGCRQRGSHHEGRPMVAPLPARRAAAVRQHPARRHELGWSSAAADGQRRALSRANSVFSASGAHPSGD